MRKTLLLTFLLLACAAWVAAQQGAGPQAISGATVIDGCLGGSGGNFTVTDKAGTIYQLQLPKSADTTKLNQHIGHEVRVTGTMASSAASDAAPGAADTSRTARSDSTGLNVLSVSKMDKLADSCTSYPAAPSK